MGAAPAAPPGAVAPPAQGTMSWDDAMKPAAAAEPAATAVQGGMARNIGAGIAEGAGDLGNIVSDPAGNLLGKPLAAAGMFLHDKIAPYFGGKPFSNEDRAFVLNDQVPQPGTAAVNALAGAVGAPQPSDVPADTTAQSLARTATRGAVDVAGLGGEGALASTARAGVAGATGALGSAGAQAIAPDEWKPLASILGGVAGGAAPIAVEAGARLVGGAVAGKVNDFAQPIMGKAAPVTDVAGKPILMSDIMPGADPVPVMAKPGQAQMAGAQLRAAATDPAAAQAKLAAPYDNVPGVNPTTYQQTNDFGLGQFERQAAKNNPAGFIAKQEQQNTARVAAVNAVPDAGDPGAVSELFQNQLKQIDASADAAAQSSLSAAQQASEHIGGSTVGMPGDSALQQHGNALRAPLAANDQAAKDQTTALYQALPPDMAISTKSLTQGATAIVKSRLSNDTPLNTQGPDSESAIFGVAQTQPAVQSVPEIMALDKRITSALRSYRPDPGNAQTVARLSQLLSVVRGSMSDAIEGQTPEAQAGIMQRLGSQTLPPQAGASPVSGTVGSGGGAVAPGLPPTGGSTSSAGSGGNPFPQGAGPRVPAGNSSLAAAATAEANGPVGLQPNFTREGLNAIEAAKASHADRMARYRNAPGVGAVLKPGALSGTFDLPASSVGPTLFRGAGAAERTQAFFNAGGSRDAAQDYLASDLRRSAELPDGTIDPGKLARWQTAHSEVLSQFPDLGQKFQSAADARTAMTEAATRAKADRDAFTQSAVKPFLGEGDPVAAVGRILEGDKALPMMTELAQRTAQNPEARAGLQQAAVRYLLQKATSNSDLLKSDVFQTFVKKTPAALRQIFSPDQVKAIQDVAASLKEANRSIVGTKIAGQSNTAQDTAGTHAQANAMLYKMMLVEAASTGLGEVAGQMLHHGVAGTLGGVGIGAVGATAAWLSAMRQAGIAKVSSLAELAALHPPLARTLMAQAPTSPTSGTLAMLRAQLAAVTAAGAMQRDQKRAPAQPMPSAPQFPRVSAYAP